MGDCVYCGKPAGIFRTKHTECEVQHFEREREEREARLQVVARIAGAIAGDGDFAELDNALAAAKQRLSIAEDEQKRLLIAGFEQAVESCLEDHVLDEQEERRIVSFMSHFGLTKDDVNAKGSFVRLAKSAVLRDVMAGKLPERVTLDTSLAINFQKGERLVWAFPNCRYLEDKTRRQYVGGSQGVGIRVMKGVYYRAGAFKGHSVESTERVHVDTGWVALTDRNIYFAGPAKSLRIPYQKIVSFEPFSDGFGVIRDAASAKPQIFVTGDGWFAYNLAVNLAQL